MFFVHLLSIKTYNRNQKILYPYLVDLHKESYYVTAELQ